MPRNWWFRRYATMPCAAWQTDERSSARPRSRWLIERQRSGKYPQGYCMVLSWMEVTKLKKTKLIRLLTDKSQILNLNDQYN
ncbi:MAG: hypothetical protein ACFFDN_25875 [Candidatus Hodarchaeota archaeon]